MGESGWETAKTATGMERRWKAARKFKAASSPLSASATSLEEQLTAITCVIHFCMMCIYFRGRSYAARPASSEMRSHGKATRGVVRTATRQKPLRLQGNSAFHHPLCYPVSACAPFRCSFCFLLLA